MTDLLDELAALARALDHHVVIYRDVYDVAPDDTWSVTETMYRGWFVARPPTDTKGERSNV